MSPMESSGAFHTSPLHTPHSMKKCPFFYTLGFFTTLCLSACHPSDSKQQPAPSSAPDFPRATPIPHTFQEHGQQREDPYYWLKDKHNPEVIRYLEAENAYTQKAMKHTESLQESLYQEMKSRVKEDDRSVPYLENGYYYYQRQEKNSQYPIYCRKKDQLQAPEEIILNGNTLAAGQPTLLIGGLSVSPDRRYLAYRYNHTGSYVSFTLRIRDLHTGRDVPNQLQDISEAVWANDSRTLLVVRPDNALRPFQAYYWNFSKKDAETLVYEEKDPLFELHISKSKDGKLLFLGSSGYDSSEFRMLDAAHPERKPQLIAARKPGYRYYPSAHHQRIYFLVKESSAPNFHVLQAPLRTCTNPSTWKPCIPHDPRVRIDQLEVFASHLVLYIRENGQQGIRLYDPEGAPLQKLPFPESVFALFPGDNPDYHSSTLRYGIMSPNRPLSIYAYNLKNNQTTLLKQTEVPGGFDPAAYSVQRIPVSAADGAQIPLILLYRKGLRLQEANPVLLYAYGAYGYSSDPLFEPTILSLVDRGFIYAIAQVRGGSEMGETWYEQGRLLHKKNTFTDFIACAEYLIQQKYTRPDLLAISGLSAGGLLMGAVTNMRPDLFQAVVAEVPFVDVLSTMFDTSIPLTTQEWEQWGNPNEKTFYQYMRSYSPYDNIRRAAYPHMLVTGGLNDSQVLFHEPAKYVARLRTQKTDDHLLILKTNMDSGHGGSTGRFDYLREEAFKMAFIMDKLGVPDKKLKN